MMQDVIRDEHALEAALAMMFAALAQLVKIGVADQQPPEAEP